MENTKKIRKLEHSSIMLISKDLKLYDEIKSVCADVKEFELVKTINDALILCDEKHFDIMIIDKDDNNLFDVLNKFDGHKNLSLKYLLIDEYNENDLSVAINGGVAGVALKPLDAMNLKLSLVVSLNKTQRVDKFKLGEGYYYDLYRDRVYDKNGKAIDLTKLEFGLLKLLIDRQGELVDYDMIADSVWKGKKMSIFTMRNVVNKIRTKTYYGIFANASSRGYILG